MLTARYFLSLFRPGITRSVLPMTTPFSVLPVTVVAVIMFFITFLIVFLLRIVALTTRRIDPIYLYCFIDILSVCPGGHSLHACILSIGSYLVYRRGHDMWEGRSGGLWCHFVIHEAQREKK